MKRLRIGTVCLGFLVACQIVSAQTATEKAEKRLADLLAPGGTSAAALPAQPLAWKASAAVEDIAARVKPFAGATVRLPQSPGKEVRPRAVPEGVPLVSYQDRSSPPKDVKLPTKPLIRLPSLDVDTPLPIPILAQQQKDRASLGDPALEASLSAALKRLTPARSRPVPFMALNLPDPFEHVRAGQLRNPPDENPMPPLIPFRKPK